MRPLPTEEFGLQALEDNSEKKGPTVVIVGGGFGGLRVAKGLRNAPVSVVLVDRRNHHLFQPLLYQVASAALSPADIARPIRSILRAQKNTQVLLDEVTAVDPKAKSVHLRNTEPLQYDWLVLAAGAGHAYFGNEHWASFAPGLKSIEDALEIRRRVLLAYEAAEQAESEEERLRRLTFVVVGAGPTGVEMAGALREIASETIPADFRRVDTRTARVVLVEGKDRVLSAMSKRASDRAQAALTNMSIEVRLNTFVTDVDAEGVLLGQERLEAANVIWAAGVRASSIGKTLGSPTDAAGRVVVEADCSVKGHPRLFVVGDMASQTSGSTHVPGVAQGAIQMGDFVARLIEEEARTGSRRQAVFTYRDKGSLATIGRARAVADVFGTTVGGLGAWLLWSGVHIAFLIGFRNKTFVILSWMWTYIRNTRGARLITGWTPGESASRKLPRPEV